MNIEFTGVKTQNDNFEISFQAIVDEVSVACVVAHDALSDIDPDYANSGSDKQYENSQAKLESIAREKILDNQITENRIRITKADVAKYKST